MTLIIPLIIFFFASTIFLARNPVYGVLSFVIVVAQIVLLLIGLNLEFLAYTLAIVYIGAIVVLFLFVIMMFSIKEGTKNRSIFRGMLEYSFLGLSSSIIVGWYSFYSVFEHVDYSNLVAEQEFARLLAYLLFNNLSILTIAAAFIMFVGIVGTIILTLKIPEASRVSPARVRSTIQEAIDSQK